MADRSQAGLAQNDRLQSQVFGVLIGEVLATGNALRFQARGASMSPAIRDGETVYVKPAILANLRIGDIVLVRGEMGFRLHRLVLADVERDVFITRGDCGRQDDPAVSGKEILGIAEAKDVRIGRGVVRASLSEKSGRFLCCMARGQRLAAQLLGRG